MEPQSAPVLFGSALEEVLAAAAEPPADGQPAEPASYVVDRKGHKVPVLFDHITERNGELCRIHPRLAIDAPLVTAEVTKRFRNGMSTRELDAETVMVCAQHGFASSAYGALAARICVSDLHKRVPADPLEMYALLEREAADPRAMRASPELVAIVRRGRDRILARLKHERDYRFQYFGFQTMLGNLLRPGRRTNELSLLDTRPSERPQHAYMRVALGLFVCQPGGDGASASEEAFARRLGEAFAFYDALSLHLISQATPTMLNAGTVVSQLSSCFQLAIGDDLDSILEALTDAGKISKWSGGVSAWVHAIRGEGAPIRRTTGTSSGLKLLLRLWNDMQCYVDQGGSRPGAFAMTIADHHPDVLTALKQARRDGGVGENLRASELKYALWVSDLFMQTLLEQIEAEERAERGAPLDPAAGTWHLFDPDTAPGLHLVHGAEFEELYRRYAKEGRAKATIKAGDLIQEAFKTWVQMGVPYVMFKDAINAKSNMKNVAPICSSNLCCEITIPSWSDFDAKTFARFHPDNGVGGEYGVCTLGAVNLAAFVDEKGSFNFKASARAAALEVQGLERVLDLNYAPTEECRRGSARHRTLGIGLIGLADVFAMLGLAYDSPEARRLAMAIAAAHYFGALSESAKLGAERGSYASYKGSPASSGVLQPDLWVARGDLAPDWEETVAKETGGVITPAHWRWLRGEAKKGLRHAYVVAYMPTATSANIVGRNESFEPFTSNLYTRRTRGGEHVMVNSHLIAKLTELGLWNEEMRRALILNEGSVQRIDAIPAGVKRLFLTAREMHSDSIVGMVQAMAPFVCQSISMNQYFTTPDLPRILRALVQAWKAGLKTGVYYCHFTAAASGQKSSVAAPGKPGLKPTGNGTAPGGHESKTDHPTGPGAASGSATLPATNGIQKRKFEQVDQPASDETCPRKRGAGKNCDSCSL